MKYDIWGGTLDMRKDVWSVSKETPGTNGVFLKARRIVNGKQLFFKLSNFDTVNGFYGIECIAEILAQRIACWEEVPFVEQRLIPVLVSIDGVEYNTYAVCSMDYRHENEKRLSLEQYCSLMGHSNDSTEYLMSSEFGYKLRKFMLLDYIIYNRDRHGANIEVLFDTLKEFYRLVDVFDNGLSLIVPIVLS